MAKYQFNGLKEYAEYLQQIGANTEEICGAGVYAMADIVADAVRKNIEALPAVDNEANKIAYAKKQKAHLSHEQKKGLLDGFGISTMQNEQGYYNVKLGFAGYNAIKTRKYPMGQPNVLIARSAESGTSIMDKTPFIRPAVQAAAAPAVAKCKVVIDAKIKAMDKK